MNSPSRGASISARAQTPSIDLASLAKLLAESIPHSPGSPLTSFPLLVLESSPARLRINIRGVLSRLLKHPRFNKDLSPGADTGFLRDIEMPPAGCRAKMGGRLLPGSEQKTTKAIEQLRVAIAQQLDEVCPDSVRDLTPLVARKAGVALETLAANLGIPVTATPRAASLVPVAFASPQRPVQQRERDVARLLSAVETVEGRDWFDKLSGGVRRYLENQQHPTGVVDSVIEAFSSQRDQTGSQVRRFLDFLEDQAMSRVRFQVTVELMDAVARQSQSEPLRQYVENVRTCFERFGGAEAEGLMLRVAALLGSRADSDLGDHLRTAQFHGALPVWPEWSAQLFEVRSELAGGSRTEREVSYRFRINGDVPDTGQSAFVSRLERLAGLLLQKQGAGGNVRAAVAQAIYLWLVIPGSTDVSAPRDLVDSARALALELEREPLGTLTRVLEELRARAPIVQKIADDLVAVLRTKSRKVVDVTVQQARRLRVTVKSGIVNWAAMLSGARDVFRCNPQGTDEVEWFRYLVVSGDSAIIPQALASYGVDTVLVERSIAVAGPAAELSMTRDGGGRMLPIRLLPFTYDSARGMRQPESAADQALFDFGSGVDLEYDLRSLELTRVNDTAEKETYEQWRTALCAAFALLSYVTLWEIVRRLKEQERMAGLSAFLVRLQPRGSDADDVDGNAAVYAVSQALERALRRELPVKLQGFHTRGKQETAGFRKRGAVSALQSGLPVECALKQGAIVESIALLTYVTRPCDQHPAHPDADGYLYTSSTYLAEPHGTGFRLRLDGMRSRFVDDRRAFKEPTLVLEEIARLHAAGFRQIILLSHDYGNLRIGRAAARNAPHGSFEFIEKIHGAFPDLFVYPLRRDVFPATRLHKRVGNESAFEVLTFREHENMFEARAAEMLRGMMPVYTFATLAVVGDEAKPQSGFCTYFLDVAQRPSEHAETVKQNILGLGQSKPVRERLVAILRALHYLESEKPFSRAQLLPVLDPFAWASVGGRGASGELDVMQRRNNRAVALSVPALLSHVTKVLHKDEDGPS